MKNARQTVTMRQKELRIALVCYGGVSLAVYMHGVTKELWHLARASKAYHGGDEPMDGTAGVYHALLERMEREFGQRLHVLPDILTGASAGGINAVFLAQALHSGQSLEPLTELWLRHADVDQLLDPEADRWTRAAKFWAPPIVRTLLARPGNAVSESVAPETRRKVRHKLSRLITSRWFAPPFSGIGLARLIAGALDAMAASPSRGPLLPPGHPLDLFVTATDFGGHTQTLHLNSPPVVFESEHRLTIGFRSQVPEQGGVPLADPLELVLAARATASFPGAFPPLMVAEIDRLAAERDAPWPGRQQFLARTMPAHVEAGLVDRVSLIDGSVLVNAPFSEAMAALSGRPARREVDRRFVYIDPHPDDPARHGRTNRKGVGFFQAIFGSISAIPREQPIRDNLEMIGRQSQVALSLQELIGRLQPEIEQVVEHLFGRSFFINRPTARRIAAWRAKAQGAAARQAGYAFSAYAQGKLAGIIARLADRVLDHAPEHAALSRPAIMAALRAEADRRGLADLCAPRGGASEEAIHFFRQHDLAFRIRRLRLISLRLAGEGADGLNTPEASATDLTLAREGIFAALAPCFERQNRDRLDSSFAALAARVLDDPGAVIDAHAAGLDLESLDHEVETIMVAMLRSISPALRRRVLMAYLGYPFYDLATLPWLHDDGINEFEPVKVDRISPGDAMSIRSTGAAGCLRGVEFFHFGAFFSRAYRENDYLWGRLHGAERMVDLLCSTLQHPPAPEEVVHCKRAIFQAILDEEEPRLQVDPGLVPGIRAELAAASARSEAGYSAVQPPSMA